MIVLLKMIYKNRELSNVVHIYMNLRHVSDWQQGLRSGQSTQTVHPRPKHQCRASAPSFFVPGEVWDPANPKKSHVRLRQLSWITHVTIGSMANISMCIYIYIPLSTVQFKGFWNSHHSKIIQRCWPRHGRVIESTRSGSDLLVKLVRIRTVLVRMCRLSIPLLIHYQPYLFFAGTKKKK